jgi:hypothetical protein
MDRLLYLVRFFRVVPPVSGLMTTTFAALTVVLGGSTFLGNPGGSGTLAPVLLLQAFAAASGFATPARRGYYDLLLTRGDSRVTIALIHWVMSIAPGIAAWLVIATVERIASDGSSGDGFTGGSLAAMTLVSTIPWAVTVRLPRFSGAVGWLLVLAVGSTLLPPDARAGLASSPGTETMTVAAALLIDPVLLVGRDVSGHLTAVAPGLALAATLMAAALFWIRRSDVPLEAAQ